MARKKKNNVTLFPGKIDPMHDHLIKLAEIDSKTPFLFFTLSEEQGPMVSYNIENFSPKHTAQLCEYVVQFIVDYKKSEKRKLESEEA